MNRPFRTSLVATLALVFTYLFFIEYVSPLRKVHIPFDLEGYHYPLADYTFQELKQGRFPEWDSAIYCGQTFVGNVQAALFYPPTWLLFAANLGRSHVSYQSMQVLQLAHVWLAFVLFFVWLRAKRLQDLAALFGAGVYAFSGYLLLQLQHLGLVCAYAWFPFALWGVDEAVETKTVRPLWKVMAASALCFLAGYPPIWFVFAIFTGVYALARSRSWRITAATAAALAGSFLLSMVQLLPSLEANSLKVSEARYGLGIRDPMFYISYLAPNYYDFGRDVPVLTNFGREYLYLGAPALFGLIWVCVALFRRGSLARGAGATFAAGAVAAVFLTNPFNLIQLAIQHSELISQICRDWYFLAGVSVALSALAAYGLDAFLRRDAKPLPAWTAWLSMAFLLAWSGWELIRWLPGGRGLAAGPASFFYLAVTFFIFATALYVLRSQAGRAQVLLTVVLILGVGMDYKVFGTSLRLNGAPGSGQPNFKEISPEMDRGAIEQLRADPQHRILFDGGAPGPLTLRHYELASPQGFDPFITTRFHELVEGHGGKFSSNWGFDVPPDDDALLQLLGVRYLITAADGFPPGLRATPSFQLLGRDDRYFKVFEYQRAQPSYGWTNENKAAGGDVRGAEVIHWDPEQREFLVRSSAGGRFGFKEQFFPGWTATLDGRPIPEELWEGAFQAVQIPAGEHRLEFRFRSRGFHVGAWISALSVLALALCLWLTRSAQTPA